MQPTIRGATVSQWHIALVTTALVIFAAVAISYVKFAAARPDDGPPHAVGEADPAGNQGGGAINRVVMAEALISTRAGRDLETLVRSSHVIAVGTVTEAQVVQRPTYAPNPYIGTPVVGKEQPAVVPISLQHRTRYTLALDDLLKSDGAVASEPQALVLTDIGAIQDSTAYVYGDAPVYQVGGRYLVFMLRHPRDPARLVTAQGRFSQFAIKDGVLHGGDGLFPWGDSELTPAGAELQGMTEEQAVSSVRALVAVQTP